jgi:transaldolase
MPVQYPNLSEDLRDRLGIANAWRIYEAFREYFRSERFMKLAAHGAAVQRPLWASTGVKSLDMNPRHYVDALVAPQTVTTLPMSTFVLVSGVQSVLHIRPVEEALAGERDVVRRAEAQGVDFEGLGAGLLAEGLAAFKASEAELHALIGGRAGA